jgi:nucleotidyltransferase AbiEii toxin of type IV toxin-antitoxin system
LPDIRRTRATTDGRAYLDLQNLARRQGRPTDELHQIYALEGFLTRLTASDYAGKLILKGGVLLAAFGTRRPTRDIDLLAHDLSNAPANMLTCMKAIASIPVDDGLNLDAGSATADLIRDDEEYAGVRVTMPGSLSIARIQFHIDINIGDPVSPAPEPVRLPRILGGELVVTGCPLAMVLAEKIITMLQRRDASTRWRDFADACTLSRCRQIDGPQLNAQPHSRRRPPPRQTDIPAGGPGRDDRTRPAQMGGMASQTAHGTADPRTVRRTPPPRHRIRGPGNQRLGGQHDLGSARLSWTTQATHRTPERT